MQIPKIIHYCWFGPKPIPELEKNCIESWKLQFTDYEFMFWNENTFNTSEINFVHQAYQMNHYAFVSDYVRTKVLYEYGGLYLDTDVEILPNFPRVIKNDRCFIGFEDQTRVGTAIMGFFSGHPIMKKFMEYYINNDFVYKNGDVNTIANVSIFTDILSKHGLTGDGKKQILGDVEIFPRQYFYPKKLKENDFKVTPETIAIHKFSCSWLTERERNRGNNKFWTVIMRPTLRFFRNLGIIILGQRKIQKIEIKVRNLLK